VSVPNYFGTTPDTSLPAVQPGGLPPDFASSMEAIQRKKALANALLQQSMSPQQGQMVSGHFVGPGIVGALAPLAQALLGRHTQKEAESDQQTFTTQYNSAASQALQQYLEARKTDPRAAAGSAIQSKFPALVALGQKDLANMLTQKEVLGLPGYDATSRLAAALHPGDPDIAGLKPEQVLKDVNGQVIDVTPGKAPGRVYDARDKFGNVGPVAQTPGGPVNGQINPETGEVKYAPTGTNINLNTNLSAAEEMAKTLGKGQSEQLLASKLTAEKAASQLQTLSAATRDLQAGIKSGTGADVKLIVAKVGKALGLSDDPQIANTEAYRAMVAQRLLDNTKALGSGSGFSDKDRDFLEKVVGSGGSLDDRTMLHLIKVGQAAAANAIQQHEQNISGMLKVPGVLPDQVNSLRVPVNFQLPEDLQPGPDGRIQIPMMPQTGSPNGSAAPIDFHTFIGGGPR
jgi:hypothetical protein